MNFTAVVKRMAREGFDVHVTLEHNGWVHFMATHKNTHAELSNRDGEAIIASAPLFGDREYNMLAVLDVVALRFWKMVEADGVRGR